MKSTLKFDLNGSNEPVITAIVDPTSGDLRDKVADKFFSTLNQEPWWSGLCFVMTDGTWHQIQPIAPGQEDRFINRLRFDQVMRIIPLAFQTLSTDKMRELLDNESGTLVKILKSTLTTSTEPTTSTI